MRPTAQALLAAAVLALQPTPLALPAAEGAEPTTWWSLMPVVRPDVPEGAATSANAIDAFVAAACRDKGLTPVGPADRQTLLRRVCLDLTGLPPTVAEQETFLQDASPDAYEKLVDRLLASEQHGVRYARHWLDVLRYADAGERMSADRGMYLWRDWVIRALNDDVPYDQFVRAQLTGYRGTTRTQMAAVGVRSRVEPRPDDAFALGFLARGAVSRDAKDAGELAIAAVETVSTAFLGLTVGCAKCHDHNYDPIKQRDFYAMKALFDPLVVRKLTLASPAEVVAAGRAQDEADARRAALQAPIDALIGPTRKKLYDDRVAMLPPDIQSVIRKPEKERTAQEQKIADDYFPVLRIDGDKIAETLPEADRAKYRELQRQLAQAGGRGGPALPAFWTVEVDPKRAEGKSYVLTSGDPERPETGREVQPGWPFAPATIDFREGRVEAFADWLTAPENPLFARVAVNRLWQWHFGEGLHKTPSDFGKLGGTPTNPRLLDWLAAEFVARGFSMKAMHRLIVTSEAYKRASDAGDAHAASAKADPDATYLWRFRLRRLEAEPIWDSIFAAAGTLDPAVGGPSFEVGAPARRRNSQASTRTSRRAAYIARGYASDRDVLPAFLRSFDADDGRAPCPQRTRTVTAPQSLFLMNGEEIDRACSACADRLKAESGGDLKAAVDRVYRIALARPSSPGESERALAYLADDPARLKGLAWLLFNLDEFIYVR